MKLRTVVPIALAVGTLTAGGLVLTGHTAWIPSPGQTCSDPTGHTVTYRWRYNGQEVAVTQNMDAAAPLPIELELDRLATKLA